jgi:hypothetical protein
MINPKYKDFIVANSETLKEMFMERLAQIKDVSIFDADPMKRDSARELAIEFVGWLKDIGLITNPKKLRKKDTGV